MHNKTYLWAELLLLFAGLPLLYVAGWVRLPKIPLLLGAFAACLVYLVVNPAYDTRRLLDGIRENRGALGPILLRSCAVAVFSVGAVLAFDPESLFAFPRARPWFWLLVMALYPLLSAFPQELVYRAFFFQRYGPILPTRPTLVLASTLAFSFLHIIFDNWVAVVLTIPAGYLFSRTYDRTGSLLLASLEHALYGCIVFTSGLGRFFYHP